MLQMVVLCTDYRYFGLHLCRKHDYENYLCCLLLPKQQQRVAFAVRAFNVEVAQVGIQQATLHFIPISSNTESERATIRWGAWLSS